MDRKVPAASSELLDAMSTILDDAFCVCEIILDAEGRPVDYRFIEINQHFEAMTGLSDVKGRTALELVPGLERHWIETYGRVALERVPLRFQNGSERMGRFWDVYSAPIDPPGRFTIVFRDVTALKTAEAARERALAEARRLLAELSHRVTNSLSMISSIIAMEARGRSDGNGRQALMRVQARLKAVAQLYALLTRSGSIDTVDAADYLGRVLQALAGSIGEDGRTPLRWQIEPVELSTATAVPLALILNELVTNSLRYAFPPGTSGTVTVTLTREAERLALRVADDGQGMGSKRQPSEGGLGGVLVGAFVEQIGGVTDLTTGAGGTAITVRFPAAAQPAMTRAAS